MTDVYHHVHFFSFSFILQYWGLHLGPTLRQPFFCV
jgi:hypothetical protein